MGPLLALLALLAGCGAAERAVGVPGGDPERGREALRMYACHTCHVIPGVVGADKHVGPPLTAMANRRWIAGALPNAPENMIRWIMDPQSVERVTAMPHLEVTEPHARDMAAYLYTLR